MARARGGMARGGRVLLEGQRRVLEEIKRRQDGYPSSGVPFDRPDYIEGLRRRGLVVVEYRCWLTGAGREALRATPPRRAPKNPKRGGRRGA